MVCGCGEGAEQARGEEAEEQGFLCGCMGLALQDQGGGGGLTPFGEVGKRNNEDNGDKRDGWGDEDAI